MGIEIPPGLQWVAYLAGEKWPKGDETAMFQISDDWTAASQQMLDVVPKLQQAQSQAASAVTGQTADGVAAQFQSLLSGDTSIQNLANSMAALGSLAKETGAQIQYTKLQILSTLAIAAAEIAYALSAVDWTFFASLAWIPPIEAITIAVVEELAAQLVRRLIAALAETLTMTGLRQLLKDAAVGAAVGTAIGFVQDLAIEVYQIKEGVRSGIDWGQVGEIAIGAVVGGAAGAVAHGLLSHAIGDSSTIVGKVVKGGVTHFGVGAISNVAGAVATGGGLDADDIFGGAGAGGISGGIHGAKEHPDEHGGSDSDSDTGSDTDTLVGDDEDDASIKTLSGPNFAAPPTDTDHELETKNFGPEGDSDVPAGLSENGTNGRPPAIDDSPTRSAAPSNGSASTDPGPTDAVPSAANGSSTAQGQNGLSGNGSGTQSGARQSHAESVSGSGNAPQGQGRGSSSIDAVQPNSGNATKSSSTLTGAGDATSQHNPANRGSGSASASAPRTAVASSAVGTTEGAGGARSPRSGSNTGASRPSLAGAAKDHSGGGASVARGPVSGPPVIARTTDSSAVDNAGTREGRSGADDESVSTAGGTGQATASTRSGEPGESPTSHPAFDTPHDNDLTPEPAPAQSDPGITHENRPADNALRVDDAPPAGSDHEGGIQQPDMQPDVTGSIGDPPAALHQPSEMSVADRTGSATADPAAIGDTGAAAESPTRSTLSAVGNPEATDAAKDAAHPVPAEHPSQASASSSAGSTESRSNGDAVARRADDVATRSVKPRELLHGLPPRDGASPTRSRAGSEGGEHSAPHESKGTSLAHDQPEQPLALRLRGGAGEGNRFRQLLNKHARRVFGSDHQHVDSNELVDGLKDKARQVQADRDGRARPHPHDGFGLDLFGLREPSPTPPHLQGVKLAEVPTAELGGHIHALDMARRADDPPPHELGIWSERAPSDGNWFQGSRGHWPRDRLPDPLEMPKVFHSIWLGGSVTDGRKTTDLVRRNLERLSKVGQREGLRVVLWTDVTRAEFERPGSDAARMLSWARRHNVILLSPNEVFHRDEPMTLAGEYRLENSKGTAAGYTAASDILRLEILHRFGGIYTDHDNQVRRLDGLRNLLGAPGFALHSGGGSIPNNSALLAARGHPFVKRYLERIKTNYQRFQDQLHPNVHDFVANTPQAHHETYVRNPALAIRRRSVIERTGPLNFSEVAGSFNLHDVDVPRIRSDQLSVGSAHTWLSTKPRRFTPEQAPKVLEHAVSGLIWDLRNRRGDLNLAAVAPLIEGLPDPAAGWQAVVSFMHSVPELRQQVRTVTYAYLQPKSSVPIIGDRLRVRRLDLPGSVLSTFGLPEDGRITDLKGTWRRAAFSAAVESGEWGTAARATLSGNTRSLSGDTRSISLAGLRDHDTDSDEVLHGLADNDLVALDQPSDSDRPSAPREERADQSGPLPEPRGAGRSSSFPHSHRSIDDIREWIGDVNNDGDATVAPAGPRLANCAPATIVVHDQLSGIASFRRAYVGGLLGDRRQTHELTRDELAAATGLPFTESNPDEIADRLVGDGPGAHTVVAVKYRNGQQHSFNAFFDGTQVHALDGQHGTITHWPPHLDRVDNPVDQWFMGTRSDAASGTGAIQHDAAETPASPAPLQGLHPAAAAKSGAAPERTGSAHAQHAGPNPPQHNDTDAAGETTHGPASRLRGGSTGAADLFGSLRYHADRVLRPRVDSEESSELITDLDAQADRIQTERARGQRRPASAEDRFGPDPFGLRDPAPTPEVLRNVRLADVSTEELGSHLRSLDLAGTGEDKEPSHDQIWSEQAPPDGKWWWPEDLPEGSDPLPDLPPLPERLEMPKLVHSIWLGGPLTDGRGATEEIRRNLEELSSKAQTQGMQVALWTDVTRAEFEKNTGDVAAMRDWARSHNIFLLNTDEVFHGGEPMRLDTEYRLETGKGTPAGFTAASDILRLEILYRFGGIYTDGDNRVYDLAGLRGHLRAPGFAAHGTPPNLNNSALLAARKHPFVASLLDTIADNYRLRQDELQAHNHVTINSRRQHADHYVGRMALRRRSVTERTGPTNLEPARERLGLTEVVPRIREDKIQMASAKTWLRDSVRRYPPEKTSWVLQHAISGLIWDLRNRRGDLNLVAVAPLIEGLSNPAAGWEAVVGYIHRIPQLRLQVQSVTYSHIEYDDSAVEHLGRDRELELPQSVRDMLGLPPHGQASDVPGVWRRAAFGTQVGSPDWSYLTVDFPSGERQHFTPNLEVDALVAHLRNLGDQWDVEVSVEGGGAAVFNNAGMDRATAVRQYLEPLIGNTGIKWNDPTSRGPGPTKSPVPPEVLENRRQVVVSWKAKPTGPAGEIFSEDELDEGHRTRGSRGLFADTLRRLRRGWSGGPSDSSRPAVFAPSAGPGTGYVAEQFDATDLDDVFNWRTGPADDSRDDLLRGLPGDDQDTPKAEPGPKETPAVALQPSPPADHVPAGALPAPEGQNEIADVDRSLTLDRNPDQLPTDRAATTAEARAVETAPKASGAGVMGDLAAQKPAREDLVAAPGVSVSEDRPRELPDVATSVDARAPKVDEADAIPPKAEESKPLPPKAEEPAPVPPKAEEPKPDPQLPARIGNNLVLGGIDVVEQFHSADEGLRHIEQLVRRFGGAEAWEANREQITAIFSDDSLRSKVPGMLRGGQTPSYTVRLAFGRTLTIGFRVDGASEESELHFKESIDKYEFEHTSDPTNIVGSFDERRGVLYAGVQGSLSHPAASDSAAIIGSRTHDSSLRSQRADRQISGGQTAEPGTRFHGTIKAAIDYRLSSDPGTVHTHELSYHTQVVVPTRDVTDRRVTVEPAPGEATTTPASEPGGPPKVLATHALTGSDIVTNFRLLPDDPPPHAPRPETPARGPSPEAIADFVNGASMRRAFEKAYGKLAQQAIDETIGWLTIEQLQANLHGMSNKQPLVLEFEGLPGARLEVHAFVEPLGTPSSSRAAAEGSGGNKTPMMRATGKTKETEFHYGTETDTSAVHQDAVTWSAQVPTPGRFRGQGGSDAGQVEGGLDGAFTRSRAHNETDSHQFRVRNTLKNPAPGQAWEGQVRLRFEMHSRDAVSPSGLDAPFKGAVHETRGRFDVIMEQFESSPTQDYIGTTVWAPPSRIWGEGPSTERNSVAKSPWWRLGTGGRHSVTDAAGTAKPAYQPAPPVIHRGAGKGDTVPLRGLGSMDRVTNLDLSGFHGMLDTMGRRAFGNDWKNVRSDVSAWYHLNRVRSSLPGMTQHSPLTRTQLSGRGSKAKAALTADFERLTFRRVINTLSSPSTEITQGKASTTDRGRQTSVQGALGGRGGEVEGSKVLGEVIAGVNRTVRDGERVRDQERVAVATKFDQPMAIFEGWVRIDGTMTGSKATVHESGLFPVEIAIPLTELQGSRQHDSVLPPTFTRDAPTGFIDHPRNKPAAESAQPAAEPVRQVPEPVQPAAEPVRQDTEASVARAKSDRRREISYVVDRDARDNLDAFPMMESPADEAAPTLPVTGGSAPARRDTFDSTLSDQSRFEGGINRAETFDSTTPLLPKQQGTVDNTASTRTLLTDVADGAVPTSPPRIERQPLDWTAPPKVTGPRPPDHAFQEGWHPSDMLVGVDPASGLVEAIRQDLTPALGDSLDHAMTGLSDQFGPSVLLARLTHESGREWLHDVPVPGGKIRVKVRPVRAGDRDDFEFIGTARKFETDLSIESQSSTARIHGDILRAVKGGRIQIPIPHGSVSVQVTHTTSVRPKGGAVERSEHGSGQPRAVDFPSSTGESENRIPQRVRTTEEHQLFRQPIHFEITYEHHGVSGTRLKGLPEAPQPVRLGGVFSYPKSAPTATKTESTGREPGGAGPSERQPPRLKAEQTVVKIRPHAGPGPRIASERSAGEDHVATHILDSLMAQGKSVFGANWPKVRAELAEHVRTMAVQRDLGHYSRGGTQEIRLKSVPGTVVLSGHLDTFDIADSKATTEFYSGGQQSHTAGVSDSKVSNWQGYVQAQGDILPTGDTVNLSALGRLSGGIGTETTNTHTESSATGTVFRQKVPTRTHVGTATIAATMTYTPSWHQFGDQPAQGVAAAHVEFTTREGAGDDPPPATLAPRDRIVTNGTGGPSPGLSRDSIVRAITDGENFRARTLENLKRVPVPKVSEHVKHLTDSRVVGKLAAMTRITGGEEVELFRQGTVRITGRAEVHGLEFDKLERTGGNAYVLNDVNRGRQNQPADTRERGARLLFGPHVRFPGFQATLLGGGGATGRERHAPIFGQNARVAANAKFPRSHAVFNATTRITLTVHYDGAKHELPGIDVHGPILIPEAETRPVDAPSRREADQMPLESKPVSLPPKPPGPDSASDAKASSSARRGDEVEPGGGAVDLPTSDTMVTGESNRPTNTTTQRFEGEHLALSGDGPRREDASGEFVPAAAAPTEMESRNDHAAGGEDAPRRLGNPAVTEAAQRRPLTDDGGVRPHPVSGPHPDPTHDAPVDSSPVADENDDPPAPLDRFQAGVADDSPAVIDRGPGQHPGVVSHGGVTTPFDAWNGLVERDPGWANDLLTAARSKFVGYDLGGFDDAIRAAYGRLSDAERGRNLELVAEYLHTAVLDPDGGWGVSGGARGSGRGEQGNAEAGPSRPRVVQDRSQHVGVAGLDGGQFGELVGEVNRLRADEGLDDVHESAIERVVSSVEGVDFGRGPEELARAIVVGLDDAPPPVTGGEAGFVIGRVGELLQGRGRVPADAGLVENAHAALTNAQRWSSPAHRAELIAGILEPVQPVAAHSGGHSPSRSFANPTPATRHAPGLPVARTTEPPADTHHPTTTPHTQTPAPPTKSKRALGKQRADAIDPPPAKRPKSDHPAGDPPASSSSRQPDMTAETFLSMLKKRIAEPKLSAAAIAREFIPQQGANGAEWVRDKGWGRTRLNLPGRLAQAPDYPEHRQEIQRLLNESKIYSSELPEPKTQQKYTAEQLVKVLRAFVQLRAEGYSGQFNHALEARTGVPSRQILTWIRADGSPTGRTNYGSLPGYAEQRENLRSAFRELGHDATNNLPETAGPTRSPMTAEIVAFALERLARNPHTTLTDIAAEHGRVGPTALSQYVTAGSGELRNVSGLTAMPDYDEWRESIVASLRALDLDEQADNLPIMMRATDFLDAFSRSRSQVANAIGLMRNDHTLSARAAARQAGAPVVAFEVAVEASRNGPRVRNQDGVEARLHHLRPSQRAGLTAALDRLNSQVAGDDTRHGRLTAVSVGGSRWDPERVFLVENEAVSGATRSQLGDLYEDNRALVRGPRSYADDRGVQVLRWMSTALREHFAESGEVQAYFDREQQTIYVSSNTNAGNRQIRDALEQPDLSNLWNENAIEEDRRTTDEDAAARATRHQRKLRDALTSLNNHDDEVSREILQAIRERRFVVPTESYNEGHGRTLDLHAERRIYEMLRANNRTMDLTLLAGTMRACGDCADALGFDDARPRGPFWRSRAAGAFLNTEATIARNSRDGVPSHVTGTRRGRVTNKYNTESDSDHRDNAPKKHRKRK
ncbi:WXG100-like domain-containing protein [Mycobacterium simiae]|uniref:WXG100-like domain-containing protein n=3 Tax=Mycobacterium simiae TaxID=1784 RepID=UPI00138D795E|nr:glycosyltransferase [Mycobacterium simiae]BBX39881.1 hypothetical protein MSIM_13320 [Mycobacterium simiae]